MNERPYNRLLGSLRLLATYALIVALVVFSRPVLLSVGLGLLIALIGEAIRIWAAGHLHKTVELAISGPYLYTRNPLYLGRLLIFTGLCIMATLPHHANYGILALGYAVFFAYYLPRKERVEPMRLLKIHGQAYQRYHHAVSALFPSLQPYDFGEGPGWSVELMLRNREHWTILGLLLIAGYLLWRAW